MRPLSSFVVWICRKFNRTEIEHIISGLLDVVCDPESPVKPKDSFKEEHPNYRKFEVDPNPPLTEKRSGKKKRKNRGTRTIS